MSVPSPGHLVLLGRPPPQSPAAVPTTGSAEDAAHLCHGASRLRDGLRVLQEGHSSAGCESQGQLSPGRSPGMRGAVPGQGQTDTLRRLCLPCSSSVPEGQTEQKQLLPHLHPNSAAQHFYLISTLPEGENAKGITPVLTLSSLLTASPRDPKPHGVFLAGNKEHL